ncbi:MAG: TlpA disulfide reductase family protein [Steroidobacteraceae bacterium]
MPLFTAHAAAVDLAEFRGNVVYLDFWASWCAPCRQSFPWMQTMQDAYGAQGLRVVAVNVDQYRADAERFLAKFHPNFDVRFDPLGELTVAASSCTEAGLLATLALLHGARANDFLAEQGVRYWLLP